MSSEKQGYASYYQSEERHARERVEAAIGSSETESVKALGKFVEEMVRKGNWTAQIEEETIHLGRSYNPVQAERFIEHSMDELGRPDFDFETYSKLVPLAYQRFGMKAAAQFTRSYNDVRKQGIDPNAFFESVDTAVDAGGKLFAARYASRLPEYLEKGGDLQTLRVSGAYLRGIGSLRLADTFMYSVPHILGKNNPTVEEFTDMTEDMVRRFGRETTGWTLPGVALLHAYTDYPPVQAVKDLQQVQTEVPRTKRGKDITKWFGYGLSRLGKFAYAQLSYISGAENYIKKYPKDEEETKQQVNEVNEYSQRLQAVNPDAFKAAFINIANRAGSGAAVFYSLMVQPSKIQRCSDLLLSFHDRVSKKVFTKTMWFGPKINSNMEKLFTNVLDIYQQNLYGGEKEAITALQYTAGIVRDQGYKTVGLGRPEHLYRGELATLEDLETEEIPLPDQEPEFTVDYDWEENLFLNDAVHSEEPPMAKLFDLVDPGNEGREWDEYDFADHETLEKIKEGQSKQMEFIFGKDEEDWDEECPW